MLQSTLSDWKALPKLAVACVRFPTGVKKENLSAPIEISGLESFVALTGTPQRCRVHIWHYSASTFKEEMLELPVASL